MGLHEMFTSAFAKPIAITRHMHMCVFAQLGGYEIVSTAKIDK